MSKRIKLVAGVKSFSDIAVVPVPVKVTKYRISNGRVFLDAEKANKAQQRLALKHASTRIRSFLKSNGLTFPSTDSMVSVERLAAALLNPKFAAKLHAISG